MNPWGLFQMALWNDAANGPVVYVYDPAGSLKAFQIENNRLNSTILSQFSPPNASFLAGLSVSANAGQNGIVWLVTGNSNVAGDPATLYALDATNVAQQLWSSDTNNSRDQPGSFTKFATPTVTNGRVYLPTLSDAVVVYGSLQGAHGSGTPLISSVVNSASFLPGAVAPGELVTIYGANLGPTYAEQGIVDSVHVLDNSIEATQVFVDGIAAPILYVSPSQINLVIPFGVSGTSTQIQIVYQGQPTASTTVPVQAASPALFSLNSSGGGPGAILNQDGTVNSSSNAAAPGSVVVLYATGAGLTTPASVDGLLATAPYPMPNLPVSVTIDGVPAQILYAGAAPGQIGGVLQINVVVPAGADAAPFDEIVVTVGDFSSPSAVTVAVG